MKEIKLSEYLKNNTQEKLANALGLTQGAISQMLIARRDIRIITDGKGNITAKEVKPIKNQKK